jgi:hypothetical protein
VSLKVCPKIGDRPSIDEVNLCCLGSVDGSVDNDQWPVNYVWRGHSHHLNAAFTSSKYYSKYNYGHAFSTSLALPRDELAGFRSEATEFS